MTTRKPARGHAEAHTLAFTQFILDGVSWNLTMREGVTADETLALLVECRTVQQALAATGAVFVLNRDARETLQRQPAPRPHNPPPPSNGNGNGQPKAASVKTAAWALATAELAARHGCFRRADGKPDWHGMTHLVAEAGFREITDANLTEIVAALEEAAESLVAV